MLITLVEATMHQTCILGLPDSNTSMSKYVLFPSDPSG